MATLWINYIYGERLEQNRKKDESIYSGIFFMYQPILMFYVIVLQF